MEIVKIEYPTDLSKIEDINNDNLDVFVELEDGFVYNAVVSTPKNYYWYMEKENKNYYCGLPEIIVKSLTEETVAEAMMEYAGNDAYWIKCYYLPGVIYVDTINQYHILQNKQKPNFSEGAIIAEKPKTKAIRIECRPDLPTIGDKGNGALEVLVAKSKHFFH